MRGQGEESREGEREERERDAQLCLRDTNKESVREVQWFSEALQYSGLQDKHRL